MLASLPDRPLNLSEVQALHSSAGVSIALPTVALDQKDPTASVIAIALVIDSTRRLIGFDPAENGWAVIATTQDSPTANALDAVSETVIEWLIDAYSRDEIVVFAHDSSDDSLISVLPKQPLSKGDLPALEVIPGVEDVYPMFALEDSQEIIAILTGQPHPEDTEGFILANYGFNPESSAWEPIERAAVGADQMDTDIDTGELDIHEWVREYYDGDELLAIKPDGL